MASTTLTLHPLQGGKYALEYTPASAPGFPSGLLFRIANPEVAGPCSMIPTYEEAMSNDPSAWKTYWLGLDGLLRAEEPSRIAQQCGACAWSGQRGRYTIGAPTEDVDEGPTREEWEAGCYMAKVVTV